MIILQFNDLHFIMTTSAGIRMHVTFGAPIALRFVKAVRIIAIHAVVKIHQHTAGEGEINNDCKRCY